MNHAGDDPSPMHDRAIDIAAAGRGRRHFHGLYQGETFGNPQRGMAAVLTQSSGSDDLACQLAAHGFAEGYFGLGATLGAPMAAARALLAINGWLWRQSGSAEFAAMLLAGRRVSFVIAGRAEIHRWRDKHWSRITAEDDDRIHLALGTARDVPVGLWHDEPQPDDIYLIAIGSIDLCGTPREVTARAAEGEGDAAAMLIEIGVPPLPSLADVEAQISTLPVARPPQEGETLDGFLIGRTIYRSRYTLLRQARDLVEKREVLLKFPLPAMAQDQVFQAGFMREAWVGARVKSDWIANYIELAPDRQSCLYIALPFYRGETLENRLARQPPMGVAEGVGIALGLCAAVGDLDRLQIVHRDLKPDNIILTGGGLRLVDLGLAYLPGLDDPEEERLGGTTRYMAPELFKGAAPGPTSEVFSIGVTLYRMFAAGASPFGQREAVALAAKRPDLPAWLGQCLARALVFDPAHRWQTARDLADALGKGLKQADQRPASRATQWRDRWGEVRLWRALCLILAVALVLALLHNAR